MIPSMTFSAAGDCFITRELPEGDRMHGSISAIMQTADARLANLEVTLHTGDAYPSAVSGGTWAHASPSVLKSLKRYGFNMLSWANNHTLDYLYKGLEQTEEALNQMGLVHAGVGKNLAAASSPRYLECNSARVALVAGTTSAHPTWIAGDQLRDCLGRPGVNLLRSTTKYVLNAQHMKALQELILVTKINDPKMMSIQSGFAIPFEDGITPFGDYSFIEGDEEGVVTEPNRRDLQRLVNSIHQAVQKSDYVLVSLHAHQKKNQDNEEPADFIVSYARACIDAGAHAVIGHGPHVLRGIEIYKRRPIFYSLGDFIYQPETVTHQPADMYEKYNLGYEHNVSDALSAMSNNYTRGHTTVPEIWETVLPVWKMDAGNLVEIVLYPIELGFGQPNYRIGWPQLSQNNKILERLQRLSENFGTKMLISNNMGYIKCIS